MIIPYLLSQKKPLFNEKIFVTRPNLPTSQELFPLVEEMLKSRWVTNFGSFHKEFEEKIKQKIGVKYVLPCCNGTMALFLLLKALELRGKVITTPFTFPATIHAITMANLKPLFCDIKDDDYTLDPNSVEKNISPSVSAILGVNIFGSVCDIQRIGQLASKYKIPVIYDSAHAFLTKYNGKYVGNFGKAEMFSFHATKLLTTIEGGAITTNDEELYNKLRLLINFGIKDEENVVSVGLNAKMSEINAIFGLLSLKRIDSVLEKLSNLSEIYKRNLADIPGLKFRKIRKNCQINNQYMPVEIVPDEFGMTRDKLYDVLKEDNVITRKYFYPPANYYECYRNEPFVKNVFLPNTENVSKNILCLPMYASLEVENVKKICQLIKSVQCHSKEISLKLGKHKTKE